jgi:hypothetical protein
MSENLGDYTFYSYPQSFIFHSKLAAWGLTGMQNEAITRTILCCDEPEGFGPEVDDEMPMAMFLNAIEEVILDTMHPVWFGRHEGYHGVYHYTFMKLIIPHIKRRKIQNNP